MSDRVAVRASTLVVRPGDRVVADGRFVRRADDDWLDLAQVDDLVGHEPEWISGRAIRIVGADSSAVPQQWTPDRAVIPGRLTVTGTWTGELIEVDRQAPSPRTWRRRERMDPPTTPGGWDVGPEDTHVDGLEELRADGAIVADHWLRHESGALILCVAASDVARVETTLGPQLPRRLCVVRSDYSAADVQAVDTTLHAHAQEWLLDSWSSARGLDARCQPYAEAALMYVRAELAEWADTLPPGLLTLQPAIRPEQI